MFKKLIRDLIKETVSDTVRDVIKKAVSDELKEIEEEGTGLALHREEKKSLRHERENGQDDSSSQYKGGVPPEVRQELARRLVNGEALNTNVRMVNLSWECKVCGLPQQRAALSGASATYDDWNGEFDEDSFKGAFACPRCGVLGNARGEAVERAKREWAELLKVTDGNLEMVRTMLEEQETISAKSMYNYVDPRIKKTKNGDDK
jgi:hypothetical protein